MTNEMPKKVSKIPSIRRLPNYLHILKRFHEDGRDYVSTTHLAQETGQEPIVVRKDLEITKVTGQPGVGYNVPELISKIEEFLGWNNTSEAFVVGAGALGNALIGHKGFMSHGLKILAAFDNNPEKIGTKIRGVPVFPLEKLENLGPRMKIYLGILCVPDSAAQICAETMVKSGIKGIWNFTKVNIQVPKDVVVQHEDLASSLAVLSVKLSQALK